jgi:hypothetical protein
MPTDGAILWAAIAGLILVMLAIIGYLIKTGFEGIKGELRKIWEKVDGQQQAAAENALAICAINTRCKERHPDHH